MTPTNDVDEIYREHFRFVWATLRRLGVHDRDLEDVAQEVFLVVHRRLDEFEGRAALRTWLYAITIRVAYNHLRRRQRRAVVTPDDATAEPVAPISTDPEANATRREAGRVLYGLLERLDDDKRAVFVLADIEGLTAPEIASIVGANPRTVYSRLRVAREQFYAGLERHHARVASAEARQRWIRGAAANDGPPPAAERRVWAALLLRLPEAGLAAASGASSTAVIAKSVALSVTIAAAGLGVIAVAASPLRDARADARAVTPTVATTTPREPRAPEPARRPAATDPTPSPDVDATPSASVAIGSAAAPAPRRAEPASVAAAPDDPLAAESKLLEDARLALRRGDAAAALRSLETHERRFPAGTLADQRDRTKLPVLCALERVADATALARRLGLDAGCRT